MRGEEGGLSFQVFEATEVFLDGRRTSRRASRYLPTRPTWSGRRPRNSSQVHPRGGAARDPSSPGAEAAGIDVDVRAHREDRSARRRHSLIRHGTRPVTKARRAIVAIGRAATTAASRRALARTSDKVFNRLYDPKEFAGKQCARRRRRRLGAGDRDRLGTAGAHVTLSYRKSEGLARPKPENVEKIRALERESARRTVAIETPSSERVTTATGRVHEGRERSRARSVRAALGTAGARASSRSRRSCRDDAGKDVRRFRTTSSSRCSAAKRRSSSSAGPASRSAANGSRGYAARLRARSSSSASSSTTGRRAARSTSTSEARALPVQRARPGLSGRCDGVAADSRPATLLGTLALSLQRPGLLLLARLLPLRPALRHRSASAAGKTPYVTRADRSSPTACRSCRSSSSPIRPAAVVGHNGALRRAAFGQDRSPTNLFPAADYGHGREYWRAFGLDPRLAALRLERLLRRRRCAGGSRSRFLQTFVADPADRPPLGKGAYCGWICSCGALAETMGDAHRQKMPHGPLWNRREHGRGRRSLALALRAASRRAVVSLGLARRRLGRAARVLRRAAVRLAPVPVSAELLLRSSTSFLAGIVGVGFYFWFSRPRLVPVRLPARGADAHLRALLALPHLRREVRSASRATSARRSATRGSTS